MKNKTMTIILAIMFIVFSTGSALAADDAAAFVQSVCRYWPQWSGNSDTVEVQHLIDILPERPMCGNADDAVTLAAITRYYRFVGKSAAVRCDELVDKSVNPPVLAAAGKAIVADAFFGQMRSSLNTLAAQGYPLYANGQPQFGNIQQNKIGDCFLISAIGYIVHNNPDLIPALISPVDGSNSQAGSPAAYTVRFPQSPKNGAGAVRVELSPAEIAFFSSAQTVSDGIWEPVLQKAVARQLLRYYSGKAKLDRAAVLWNLELNHSPAAWIQEIFSGCENVQVYQLGKKSISAGRAAREVRGAIAGKRIVQAMKGRSHPTPQYPGDHWYAILAIGDDDTLTIWNPWGDNHSGRVDGISYLPLAAFLDDFAWLVISN